MNNMKTVSIYFEVRNYSGFRVGYEGNASALLLLYLLAPMYFLTLESMYNAWTYMKKTYREVKP